MDVFYSIFAGLGGVFWLVMTALALLTPIMIYLIQRNTCQTRDELRALNNNINALTNQMAKQAAELKEIQKNTPEPDKTTVSMTCEHCGKSFKYGTKHSGTYKQCPGCGEKILLK